METKIDEPIDVIRPRAMPGPHELISIVVPYPIDRALDAAPYFDAILTGPRHVPLYAPGLFSGQRHH